MAIARKLYFFTELATDVKNIGDLALKIIGNINRSIGQLFAKQAASKIFGLIFKSAVGFRDGGTVENYEEEGTVSNRIVPTTISDKLQQISAPIHNAFNREGSAGRLAVFRPVEEILSIKTGEAGRYQRLKKEFGVNPLEKIFAGNFDERPRAAVSGRNPRNFQSVYPEHRSGQAQRPVIGQGNADRASGATLRILNPPRNAHQERERASLWMVGQLRRIYWLD
ncbi:MAG: hypothetical protein AB4372_09830 [Xenococcus sp. (in: cyanobacteria)]